MMMNVVLSCLEVNVMNNSGYVKGFLTYTHTNNEWMNEANDNVMNESLLKSCLKVPKNSNERMADLGVDTLPE